VNALQRRNAVKRWSRQRC